MLNLALRMGGVISITVISSLLHRQTVIQKYFLGGSAIASIRPPPELVKQAESIGFSPYAAPSAVRAALGRELGRAANVRAYQNLYYMCGIAMVTSLLPA